MCKFPAWLERVGSPFRTGLVFAVYGLLHACAARLAGAALALDDVKLNILAQSWRAGYLPENPPFFEYLLILVQTVAGPTLISFLIVKYSLLTASGVLAFLIAREAGSGRAWAAATAFSMVLLYQIGWNYHQAFTHTLALIAATLFFWWAFVRYLRDPDPGGAALFGAAAGIGLIAKYSFAGVLAAALIAAAARADSRRALASPWGGVALGIAALIVAPHIHWLLTQNEGAAGAAVSRLQGTDDPHWRRALEGLPAAAWAIAAFFLPFALVVGAILRPKASDFLASNASRRLLRDAAFVAIAGLLCGVVALGVPSLQERYAIAILLPAFFWLMAGLEDRAAPRGRAEAYVAAVGVFAAATVLLRVLQAAAPGHPFCSDCRQWVPYEALARTLDAAGFEAGTIVGFTDHTAGNLRRLFPEARVLSAHMPFYAPPGGRVAEDCWFVWSQDLGPAPPPAVTSRFDPQTTYHVVGEWRHFARETGWRRTAWTAARVDHDAALEKALCRPSG